MVMLTCALVSLMCGCRYEKLSKDKDEAIAAASTKELRVVKQVLGHMKSSATKDEL